MKTLIVDDEHFVRKGLIYTIPWNQYGFSIVGEAEDGEQALAFMRQNETDVLITDLMMPKMSGLELMREVKRQFPNIWMIVLTCHQEFEYVREALQVGALDYLIKTQIDEGQLDEAIKRIKERIASEQQLRGAGTTELSKSARARWELVLAPADAATAGELALPADWYKETIQGIAWHIVEHPHHKLSELMDQLQAMGINRRWFPIIVDAIHAGDRFPTAAAWTVFLEQDMFYLREPEQWKLIFYSPQAAKVDETSISQLQLEWERLGWIYDLEAFERICDKVEVVKPPVAWLKSMLRRSLDVWMHIGNLKELHSDMELEFDSWRKYRSLIGSIRLNMQNREFTEDVCISVYRSLYMMRDELHRGLHQEAVAHKVNLSRGYFGQCFRPVTGLSFHEMLTALRIDRAKFILIETNDLIYSIAEQSGFKDEKYFSRVFKQQTGLLPTEYRSRRGEGRQIALADRQT